MRSGSDLFPLGHARRLAKAFPKGRLELIEDRYTFVPEDQPGRPAGLSRDFIRGTS